MNGNKQMTDMKKTILSKRFLHSVLLTLAFCLPVLPAFAQEDIVDRLDKALGVTLPSEYQSKLKTFVQSSLVFKDKDASELTEQFIKDEMKKDWGISKQSQLLFIWTALNEKINGEFLYEGSDGNENRLEEFASIMNTYDDCGKRYETAFRAHTKQRSAEAKQRSAEAKQQSAEAKQRSEEAKQRSAEYERQSAEAKQRSEEAKQRSAEYERQSAEAKQRSEEAVKKIVKLDSIWVKENMVEFYDIYTQNPNIIKQDELSFMKESTIRSIADCKKRNIDYRAILLKELGDKKKVDDLLKFYGVE